MTAFSPTHATPRPRTAIQKRHPGAPFRRVGYCGYGERRQAAGGGVLSDLQMVTCAPREMRTGKSQQNPRAFFYLFADVFCFLSPWIKIRNEGKRGDGEGRGGVGGDGEIRREEEEEEGKAIWIYLKATAP